MLRDESAIAVSLVAALYSTGAALITAGTQVVIAGVPAPVAFMAFAGAAAGLVVQPPKLSRWAMLLLMLSFTFFGACIAVAIGGIPHFGFVRNIAPAVAGITSFFAQSLVPAVRRRLGMEVARRGAPDNRSGESP